MLSVVTFGVRMRASFFSFFERGWWLGALVVTLTACQDYPFVNRPNQRVSKAIINEVVLEASDTDILFVVDNSGSMGEEQANLQRNALVFIQELALSENRYQVGVINTDVFSNNVGRLQITRATQGDLDRAGCTIGPSPDTGPPYLVRPDPQLPTAQLEAERCRLVQDFVKTIGSLGLGGNRNEAGLLAARKALDPADVDVNGFNNGFLRAEADLAVIFMTDEDDCSRASYPGSWNVNPRCYEEANTAIPVETLLTDLENLKGNPTTNPEIVGKIRAALIGGGGITGAEGGTFQDLGCFLQGGSASTNCGCWDSDNNVFFCNYLSANYNQVCTSANTCPNRCQALPATRYEGFLRELRNRRSQAGFNPGTFSDSICQAEYDDTLLNIARSVVLSSCFEFNAPAVDVNTISFEITRGNNLITVPRYDPAGNGAACTNCADCPDGAWRLTTPITSTPTRVCLDCNLVKQAGDLFTLSIINEVVGFSGDSQ